MIPLPKISCYYSLITGLIGAVICISDQRISCGCDLQQISHKEDQLRFVDI